MKRKREEKETETAASTSSSRDDGSGSGYEVFLSFRSPDTRLTMASSLYNDLIRAGIRVFKDNVELRFGKEIKGGLSQAINNSRIYIPIFSKGYASSKWCLRELALMVELLRDNDEKVILPIFYEVNADDVELKTKLYQKALRKHSRKYKSESGKNLVKKWKKALREVAGIRGMNLKDHGLDELKNLIVKEVSSLLWTRRTDMLDHLVGIKDRMDEIMELSELEATDVRFIVIHGMGGIGKTTLAEAVFRQISPQFQSNCCFLKDVRIHDIISLQKKLLFDILKLSCTNLSFISEGADMIKTKFHDKKVLIVLDDIDNQDQIMKLAGERNWFGRGSRIIITTRNIEFLIKEGEDGNVLASNSGQFSFYEMREMNTHDALQLFCERALGCAKPPPSYMDITEKLVNALGGLPLALDVVGSALRGKCRRTWKDALRKSKKVMNKDVKEKLMISYEALEPYQQQIYLDIACFFINKEKTIAIKYWDAVFGSPTEIEVKILTRMSLIKIMDNDNLWMHDQLRDLGRDIVSPESCNVDMRGSRLWSPEDAFHIVQGKKGTTNIVGLNLGTPEPDATYIFKRKEFARLGKLRFLQLDHVNFKGDFKDLFSELRWLSWSSCPSEFQATNFGLGNLAVLELSGDNIFEEWSGWSQIMVATQLKVLKLVDCPSLRKTPEFFSISRLERLILRRCTRLTEIHKSIGNLQHLDHLVLESFVLSKLPHSIGNLVKLKHVILSTNELQKLPRSIGQLNSLLELRIDSSRIRRLPSSIGNLERLKILSIHSWDLEKLPDSVGGLQSLVNLDISFTHIKVLPNCIGNLKKLKVLNLGFSHVSELPKNIGMLTNLEILEAPCTNLEGEIPSEIGKLSSLKILNLFSAGISGLLTTMNQLTNLQCLNLAYCHSIHQLPELPKSLTWLDFTSDSMTTFPDVSNLTNLVTFKIIATSLQEEPDMEGLVRLRALRNLTLHIAKMALPPTNLSSLSRLQSLDIIYADSRSLIELPSSLRELLLREVQSPIDWSVFSNLENLSSLRIWRYLLGEIQFEALEKLQKFNSLNMSDCPLLKTLHVLPGLKGIQHLSLDRLPQLTEIQGVGELKSLQHLKIESCCSIKSLNEFGLSNLQNLKRLEIRACSSLKRVPGVPKSCQLSVL